MSTGGGNRKATSQSPQDYKKAARKSAPNDGISVMAARQQLSAKVFGNEDLVACILEHTANDELDECSLVSKAFASARNRERFDQTRTGTIVFKTPIQNVPAETWHRWNQQVFTGNRTRLAAVFTKIENRSNERPRKLPFSLANVRHVVLQRDPSIEGPKPPRERTQGGTTVCSFIKAVIPNMETFDIGSFAKTTLDLSNALNFVGAPLYGSFVRKFRCLAPEDENVSFCIMQPDFLSYLPGRIHASRENANKLLEFHVDRFAVYFGVSVPPIAAYCKERDEYEQEEWFQNNHYNGPADYILLEEYPNLERVTLCRAQYLERYDRTAVYAYYKSLPQEALIKFVRHKPSLRWFCSDLTNENIAILKEERPEVHFCSYSD